MRWNALLRQSVKHEGIVRIRRVAERERLFHSSANLAGSDGAVT
jgi:hypothetical protein